MKRTPLARKTPLATVTRLARRSPLARGMNRLPPVSDKRAAANQVRRVVKAAIIAERGDRCETGCGREAVDAHELLSRARGGSITDDANIVLLCRQCHDYITTHPNWAEMHGWALNSWEKQ